VILGMTAGLKSVHEYIRAVEKELARGIATEQTYRPALKTLVESLETGVTATNEPRRIECGAPDFIVTTARLPLAILKPRTSARAWMILNGAKGQTAKGSAVICLPSATSF